MCFSPRLANVIAEPDVGSCETLLSLLFSFALNILMHFLPFLFQSSKCHSPSKITP